MLLGLHVYPKEHFYRKTMYSRCPYITQVRYNEFSLLLQGVFNDERRQKIQK